MITARPSSRNTAIRGGWKIPIFVLLQGMLLASHALGQGAVNSAHVDRRQKPVLEPGIVVEKVTASHSPEKPVLKAGDILLSWSRGDDHGEFESPTLVWWLKVERRSSEAVSVQGLRGSATKTWVLGPNDFLLEARPNFTGVWLTKYQHAQQLGRAGRAVRAAEVWLAMAQSVPTERGWLASWLCFHAGQVLSDHHLWKEANSAYQEAIRKIGDDLTLLAPIQHYWGLSLWQSGKWDEADDHYVRILADLQKAARLSAAAEFLNILAVDAFYRGDFQRSGAYSHDALTIAEKHFPGDFANADAIFHLSWVALARGDLDEAEKEGGSALSLDRRLAPGSTAVGSDLYFLSGIAIARGEFTKAEQYLREASAIGTRLGGEKFNVFSNLGTVAYYRGDLVRAEEFYRRALNADQKSQPNSADVVIDLANLADVFRDEGKLVQADRRANQGLSIAQRIDPQGRITANALGQLGMIAAARGQSKQAERYLLQSVTLQEKLEPDAVWFNVIAERYQRLAELATQSQNYERAESYYAKAMAILAPVSPGGIDYANNLAGRADLRRREGEPEAAVKDYEEALKVLEGQIVRLGGSSDVRAGFRASHEDLYRQYVGLLLYQGKPAMALEVLERSRGRTLLETLAAGQVDVRQGAEPELINRERLLQATLKAKSERHIRLLAGNHADDQISAVEKEISDLTSDYQDVEGQLRSSSPGYAALTQPQPLRADEIQQHLLDPDTLLLEYSLGEERSYVFAVTPESLTALELPPRKMIEQTARRLYGALTERNRSVHGENEAQRRSRLAHAEAAYSRAAAELSRMILGPVAAQLNGKRLLVVADGALHYVPFAALPEPETAADYAQATPLALNHEIVNLPSASVLAVLRQQESSRQPAAKAVAVLADPVFEPTDPRVKPTEQPNNRKGNNRNAVLAGSPKFSSERVTRSAADVGLRGTGALRLPRLLYTRQEADAIVAIAPAGKTFKAVDFQASQKTATSPELSKYRVVHFATHGLLNSKHPELSGLVFSMVDEQGRPQDGFLGLQDIYNINLPVDLVVLSSCQTALGEEISGEGLIGLTRGFMYAGSSRVVASLWSVDDLATAELMTRFYRAMEREKMPPAAALRKAQMEMWKQKAWHSPYYWAAFQIQGDWR